MQAGQFVQVRRTSGLKVGCIEEIAWRQGFITEQQLRENLSKPLKKSGYGGYLFGLDQNGMQHSLYR
jgi:glucose-1-phosphate thymidylyltransferase